MFETTGFSGWMLKSDCVTSCYTSNLMLLHVPPSYLKYDPRATFMSANKSFCH